MPKTNEEKQAVISIRVTGDLRDKLVKDAKDKKLTLSQLVRYILIINKDK